MKEGEKLKTLATAAGSAIKAQLNRDVISQETSTDADMNIVEKIINEWGALPKKSANQMIEKYGPPQEAIPSQLIWYNNGLWKRTIVLRDEIPHNFPQPHTDVIENVIDYKVSPEMFDELAKFDGSLYIDRTRGEASARCDMEAANFISLNLMHDIVNGKCTVEEARDKYGEVSSAYLLNRPAPYAEALQFKVPTGNTRDPDETNITKAMMHQIGKKIKDKVTDRKDS